MQMGVPSETAVRIAIVSCVEDKTIGEVDFGIVFAILPVYLSIYLSI